MNRNLLTLMLGVAAALQTTTGLEAQQFVVPASAKAEIIDATNAYRKAKGLPPLRESESASRVAEAYAHYLAEANKTGHGADGRDPMQRLHAANVKFCKFRGENWHESWTRRDKASPDTAMAAAMRFWKKSPGHERALRSASTKMKNACTPARRVSAGVSVASTAAATVSTSASAAGSMQAR